MAKNYGNVMALKEHLLEGHKVSILESLLLFGVQDLKSEIRHMRNDGYFIDSQTVTMTKIINRINTITECKAPNNLPTNEILSKEYWVNK